METEEDIIFGLSLPASNILVLRVLGNGGEQLLSAFKAIDQAIWTLQCNTRVDQAPVEPSNHYA
jgi:hypothetical protein